MTILSPSSPNPNHPSPEETRQNLATKKMPLGRGWEERLYLASDLGLQGELREWGVPEHLTATCGKLCSPKAGPQHAQSHPAMTYGDRRQDSALLSPFPLGSAQRRVRGGRGGSLVGGRGRAGRSGGDSPSSLVWI